MGDSGTVEIKRGVRLVKKHVKKDKKVEKVEKKVEDRNGENEPEAELTVKLPSKKSDAKSNLIPGAKTETEVDVLKKILADGSVEEVKTTTIKTNINGKIETETKTETRKLPKEEADAAKDQAKKKHEENKTKTVIGTNEQNGEVNENTELIVKLPSKKTGATTETKVEVENKILPDGTVEETKTTTTKTTIDGKTDITTKVDKRILSKEEADAVIEIEEEEQEEEEIEEQETTAKEQIENKANDTKEMNNMIKNEERSETTTIKKVFITQNDTNEEQESEEENQEDVSESELPAKGVTSAKQESVEVDEEEEEVGEEQEVEVKPVTKARNEEDVEDNLEKNQDKDDEATEEEEEEEEEFEEENNIKRLSSKKGISDEESIQRQDEGKEELDEEENEVVEDEEKEVLEEEEKEVVETNEKEIVEDEKEDVEEEEKQVEEEEVEKTETLPDVPEKNTKHEKPNSFDEQQETEKVKSVQTVTIEKSPSVENKGLPLDKPIKEPTVPLEKVEDIEIKPIGLANETISKSKIEKTEIVMNTDNPEGPLSTQTEFNRYENIVKVNRTTKTLDNAYEQITQNATPTMKTYFAPNREKVSPSYAPQISGLYQPSYTSDSTTERRHSLLLERLSVERQMPSSDLYQSNYQQYNNQSQEQLLWSQEPQSEVLTVSNVKPSTITNQQWYQQTKKENVIYNNVPTTPSQQWNQPQPQYQPQTPIQTQPQSPYQQPYVENTTPDYSRTSTNTFQKNNVPSFTPKTSNWVSDNIEKVENTASKYSFSSKETQKDYGTSTPQYTPGYVPPPWEQDTSYVIDNNYTQNYYQTPTSPKNTYNSISSSWKPSAPSGKFSKPVPTAYIPPAPNQSFVKPSNTVVEPSNLPGRKTYYSEYERRYITVPESTYIPGETKLQPQPDPSPKYYYDNNEPIETVEHQWRKELREFTEKTSQTELETEQGSVKPPWEEDPKYAKASSNLYSTTPSWSQTLRPRSWRERSFESEYVRSQEWPKTSTLGRSRPVSSYVPSKSDAPVSEKPRGVSVDRFNPSSYQSPIAEHPPVQSHTLTPTTAPYAKSYHNPSIPAYHARASAEPREQPATYQQPRMWGESRESPIQSRSFKYLQWITGTEK